MLSIHTTNSQYIFIFMMFFLNEANMSTTWECNEGFEEISFQLKKNVLGGSEKTITSLTKDQPGTRDLLWMWWIYRIIKYIQLIVEL